MPLTIKGIEEAAVGRPIEVDADCNSNPYYAALHGLVCKKPIRTRNADGSTTLTVGFPVCRMTDFVGAEGAAKVAALMNLGDASTDLLEALQHLLAVVDADDPAHDVLIEGEAENAASQERAPSFARMREDAIAQARAAVAAVIHAKNSQSPE